MGGGICGTSMDVFFTDEYFPESLLAGPDYEY